MAARRDQGVASALMKPKLHVAAREPMNLPIGCQVWPLRSMLDDFPSFVRMLAEIGVTQARVVFADRFRSRVCSALADGKTVRKILADHGMRAESSHFSMGELRNSHEKSIEWAKEVGITQMITATLGQNG